MTGASAMICSIPESAIFISVRPELVEACPELRRRGLFFLDPLDEKSGPSTSSGQTGFGVQTTVSIAASTAEPPFSASSAWWRNSAKSSRPTPTAGGGATAGVRDAHSTSSTSRSEEHTSELQSLMRISYAVFGLKKKTENI